MATVLGGGWQIRIEQKTVVTLYRNGVVIIDTDGRPKEFASYEEAQHVAEHWDEAVGSSPILEDIVARALQMGHLGLVSRMESTNMARAAVGLPPIQEGEA